MKLEPRYRKVVNENGWMVGLQKLCFGSIRPKFSGYCPFFWFTWLCLLLFPIVVPIHGIILLFVWIANVFGDLKDKRPFRPSDKDLVAFYDTFLESIKIL